MYWDWYRQAWQPCYHLAAWLMLFQYSHKCSGRCSNSVHLFLHTGLCNSWSSYHYTSQMLVHPQLQYLQIEHCHHTASAWAPDNSGHLARYITTCRHLSTPIRSGGHTWPDKMVPNTTVQHTTIPDGWQGMFMHVCTHLIDSVGVLLLHASQPVPTQLPDFHGSRPR